MHKGRLEAFSDGVIAIIITIMVLEMRVPHGAGSDWGALKSLIPILLSYVFSFVFLGIYWNNHHHMLHTVKHVTGKILWANLHLLFWLSLVPFVTDWMGSNQFASAPVALYGGVLLMSAISYFILAKAIISSQGKDSLLKTAIGSEFKEKLSIFLYITGIATAFLNSWCAYLLYMIVAIMWLVPDKRIEKVLNQPSL